MKIVKRDNVFYFTSDDGEERVLREDYPITEWDSPEAFLADKIRGYEPMTAKELETEEAQDNELNSPTNYVEEKFDGTRALVYFFKDHCRVFSRRISKKTGFYVENTDSLPQIKMINVPEMNGTILDGEMFINGLPFKEVSSTLNCLWDKAIDRQLEKGFISLHAFDILFYHGIDVRNLPLERRKVYLGLAVEEAHSPYIEMVEYYDAITIKDLNLYDEITRRVDELNEDQYYDELESNKDIYSHLYKCWKSRSPLTPRAYYELIVSTGGEGVIVKSKTGRYLHKRGWEYSKVKKFLTREMIVIGFDEPTKEYTGKDIRQWGYWVETATDKRCTGNYYGNPNYTPVTKFYFNNQVGNLLLGVLITKKEYEAMKPDKRGRIAKELSNDTYLMEVCECAGFDDDTRSYFTRNKNRIIGSVIEVKANELMRDSGRLRHPRYLRMRFDKEPERCIWSDHIGSSEVTK